MKKTVIRLIYFSILINLGGCHYYRTTTLPSSFPTVIMEEQENGYILLHDSTYMWHLTDIVIKNDMLYGRLEKATPEHSIYFEKGEKPARVKNYSQKEYTPANEMHIFAKNIVYLEDGQVMFSSRDVTKMQLYDYDDMASALATGALIYGPATAASVGFMVWLVYQCSCPSTYVNDEGSFEFVGGIFTGAVNRNMVRDDYLLLPDFAPTDGAYEVMLTNEHPETEYIDLTELLIIEHDDGTTVNFDKYGNLMTFREPVTPSFAFSSGGVDQLSNLQLRDDIKAVFNGPSGANGLVSLELGFQKPEDVHTGKLTLNAGNSRWLEYMFKEFLFLTGNKLDKFIDRQNSLSEKEIAAWAKDQGVYLNVYIDKGAGWEYLDYFNLAGTPNSREMALSIDLRGVVGDQVKVKLESGFMFWELDYVSMDFSENVPVKTTVVKPEKATNQLGIDMKDRLSFSDNIFVQDMQRRDSLFIQFIPLEKPVSQRSTRVLHSRGYYEYLPVEQSGKPQIAKLKRLNRPGAFSKFSENLFNQLWKENLRVEN